jgi:bifunctional DNase/RNase
MLREMRVFGLTLDPATGVPIVILKDLQDQEALPIWIGLCEASAIATEMEKVKLSRPMTHDLIKNIIRLFQAKLLKIEIHDLKDNTFFATIFLQRDDQVLPLDARPSDAIALALRLEAPIFVEERVIEKILVLDHKINLLEKDRLTEEKARKFLESMSTEQFGKYKM